MNDAGEHWIDVCAVADVPALGARVLRRAPTVADVALFKTADGELFALEDRCPHRGGPLSQGIVAGRRVTCPLHGWTIELATGEAVAPDRGSVRLFRVRVHAGRVLLEARALSDPSAAPRPAPCPLSRAACGR